MQAAYHWNQSQPVPTSVMEILFNMFPHLDGNSVEWQWLPNEHHFQAAFYDQQTAHLVEIDHAASHLRTLKGIAVEGLPGAIVGAVTANYPGFTITNAQKVKLGDGIVYYQLIIAASAAQGQVVFHLQVGKNGTIQREENTGLM